MRQIKFRGVSKDSLGWVYGNLTDNLFGEPVIEDRIDPLPQSTLPIRSQRRTKIIPETVGEFTGLTDKSGKEIYEGDILFHTNELCEVRWMDKKACFSLMGPFHMIDMMCLSELYQSKMEVIGNIHEHPHLFTTNTQNK